MLTTEFAKDYYFQNYNCIESYLFQWTFLKLYKKILEFVFVFVFVFQSLASSTLGKILKYNFNF